MRPPTPTASIADASLTEGSLGTSPVVFTVELSNRSLDPVTVDYTTVDGTAKAGPDYVPTSGRSMFAPGEMSKEITVDVLGDRLYELDERFFVNLSNPTNATIADGQAIGTIVNDDPMPSLTISDASKLEGDAGTSTLVFTLTLSAPSGLPSKVRFATADGTASAGSDYTAKTGTATIKAGRTTAKVRISITGDTTPEPNETFFVNLSRPRNVSLADAQGLGTIRNDD